MNLFRRIFVVGLLGLACTVIAAPAASAHWTNNGLGSFGSSTATMPGGITPNVSVAGRTVTVDVTQISVAGQFVGALGGGYTIKRYPANGGAPVTPGGGCGTSVTGAAATLTCTETGTPGGDWKYTVSPTLYQWTSAESAASATVIVIPDPATALTASAAPAGAIDLNWTAGGGATGYNVYRRTTAGAYNFSAPLNGATPVGSTTYNDTTAVPGTAYNYVVRSVAIDSSGLQIESANSNEPAAVTSDNTVPTGVTLNAVATPMRGTITLSGTATDTISGVNNIAFQYRLSSGGTWSTGCSDPTTPYSCNFDTTTIADGLYDFRALASDGAGNQTASTIQTNRLIDNTAPTVNLTNPGTPRRATVALTATATDGGSGMVSVAFQYKLSAGAVWTTISTDTTSPYTANFNTTALNGTYDIRALATDVVGNQGTSVATNIVLDNTRPTATDIQTANGVGILGRPDAGDAVTYTFSEAMLPTSFLAGWTGASQAVTLRLNQGGNDTMTVFNAANTTQLPFGSVRIGTGHVTASARFNATMTMSGNTIVITLGTQLSGTVATSAANVTMRWTPSATATDLAGNAMTTANRNETGAADREF